MRKRRKTHGGKRSGAGRKPTGTEPWLVRVKPETREAIKADAARAGFKTPGALLDARYGE
jgi:hypothetical protein